MPSKVSGKNGGPGPSATPLAHLCQSYHFHLLYIFIQIHGVNAFQGEWQEWGAWSQCDPSCSCGKRIRARACTASSFFGSNNNCVGESTETAPCSDADEAGCCSNTVSRIRTSSSPFYQTSCQNGTSPGWFRALIRLVLTMI